MKLFLTLLFIFLFTTLFAQYPEFAPVGATWYYSEYQLNGDLITKEITSVDSAVTFGKSCKLLDAESILDFYAYRDSLKIFVSSVLDTTWYGLYDFGKNAGDTFYARVWASFIDSIPIRIVSKGDTIINGFTLPYIITESLDPLWFFNGKAILNIGSEVYFVPPYPIADPVTAGLRCYEDDVIGEYHLVDPCDTIIFAGVEEYLLSESFSVYPNPFTDLITLSDLTYPISYVFIMNSVGQTVYSNHLLTLNSSENNITLNTSGLSSGLYFLIIKTSNGELHKSVVKY